MTDDKKIEQLMNAFYNGDTTPEEEALLLDFFNNESLNENWYADRDMFNALYDSSEITLPEGMAERLEKAIDERIAESIIVEHSMKTTVPGKEINEVHTKNPQYKKIINLFISISSAAAVILFCIGLFLVSDKHNPSRNIADTYTDPKEAAIVAEQMLTLVSSKLNQGLSPLEKVKESVDKTNELLNEKLNQ